MPQLFAHTRARPALGPGMLQPTKQPRGVRNARVLVSSGRFQVVALLDLMAARLPWEVHNVSDPLLTHGRLSGCGLYL